MDSIVRTVSDDVPPAERPAAPAFAEQRAEAPAASATGDGAGSSPGRVRPFPFAGRAAGWRTAAREFAVIVAGVLCALGAQAWWEGRQERGRERDYLRQLLADTRENERRLDESIAEDSAIGGYTARLVRALHVPGPLPPADTLNGWLMRVGSASDFQPLGGTYGALLTTGDLRLVRNDSLRARLVAYAAALESEGYRLRQLREATMGVAGPMGRAIPSLRGVFVGGPGMVEQDWARMRGDPEVWAILMTLQAANANRVAGLRRARDETRRMRRALEAEPVLARLREPARK